MADPALESAPARASGAPRGPDGPDSRPRRRWFSAAAFALLGIGVLCVGGLLIDSTRPVGSRYGPRAKPVAATKRFPPGAGPDRGAQFVVDGDAPGDNDPLWAVRQRGARATVRRISFLTLDGAASPTRRVPVGAARARFDVARWGRAGTALFSMVKGRAGVDVRVVGLGQRQRLLDHGSAPLGPPDRGFSREVSIATWSGRLPDLFVIDRGVSFERVRVWIYSGESRFRRRVAAFRPGARGGHPLVADATVHRVDGTLPDLVFMSRRGPGGYPRVLYIPGEFGFRAAIARNLALPMDLPPSYRFVMGTFIGTTTVFGIDLRDPRRTEVDAIPFAGRSDSITAYDQTWVERFVRPPRSRG